VLGADGGTEVGVEVGACGTAGMLVGEIEVAMAQKFKSRSKRFLDP
jgi:hypothetical protein